MRSIVFQFRVVARMPRADSMMRPGWPGRPPMSRVIESTYPGAGANNTASPRSDCVGIATVSGTSARKNVTHRS